MMANEIISFQPEIRIIKKVEEHKHTFHMAVGMFVCEMSIEFRRTRTNKIFLSPLLTQFPSIFMY